MIIKIIVLIIILYIVVRSIYLYIKKQYQEIEFRILKLEQRVEKYNKDQLILNKKIRSNMLDLITEFEKIEKKVKK